MSVMTRLTPEQLDRLRAVRRLNSAIDAPIWLMESSMGVAVAVKQVTTPLLALGARSLFAERLSVLLRVRHPRVATVLAGKVRRSNQLVVVSGYEARGSLYDAVSPGKLRVWPLPLPLPQAARLIGEIAAGVGALHAAGIAHGGLKLANILLADESDGQIHALVSDALLHRGVVGAPWRPPGGQPPALADALLYVAPEQFARRAAPASDQFALAVVAFVVLTGAPPYEGDPLVVLGASAAPSLTLATTLNPVLPLAVDGVLARGLAWSPRARYPTVGEFAKALADALAAREATRTVSLPPGSIPMPGENRDDQEISITQPHEAISVPSPLAVLRPDAADGSASTPGLPALPPRYAWAPDVVASVPTTTMAPITSVPQARHQARSHALTAALVAAIVVLTAVIAALVALVALSVAGR